MELKELSQSSETAKVVFDFLGSRQRYRQRSDLRAIFYEILPNKENMNYDDFLDVFEALQKEGVGKIVIGRNNNPDRFIWNYNLKEVASNAKRGVALKALQPLNEQKQQKKAKKTRKIIRRKKVKHQEILASDSEYQKARKELSNVLTMNISLSPNTRPQDIKALMELFKGMADKESV